MNMIAVFHKEVILLSALVLIIALTGCNFDAASLNQQQKLNKDDFADMEIRNFITGSYDLNNKNWELVAEKALHFENGKKSRLFKIKLEQYDQVENIVSVVDADFGLVDLKSKDIELFTNVVIVSSNKTQLKSEYVKWDEAKEELTSNVKVVVLRPNGDRQVSIGMKADRALDEIEFYQVIGDVEAE